MRCRRSSGYVLVAEVLLGLALVLVALFTVFHLFVSAESTVGLADRNAQANQLARRKLETELNRPYDQVVSFQGTEQIEHGEQRGARLVTDFDFLVQVDVPDPAKKVKVVSVTILWGTRPRHRVTLIGSKGEMW